MNGLTATVDTYLAAWNARDPARRAELIAEVWSEEGQLIDPPLAAKGRQAISEMAEAMHQHYVDHHFTRVSDVDSHHGSLRFAWQLVGPDGQVTVRSHGSFWRYTTATSTGCWATRDCASGTRRRART